jgi:hypothetical protein
VSDTVLSARFDIVRVEWSVELSFDVRDIEGRAINDNSGGSL